MCFNRISNEVLQTGNVFSIIVYVRNVIGTEVKQHLNQ